MGNSVNKELSGAILSLAESESVIIDAQESTAFKTNSKFMMTEGASEAEFGALDDFFEGATSRFGYPNPDFEKGMRTEHCERENSNIFFKTPNYHVTTSSCIEWNWVTDPKAKNIWAKYPGEIGDSVAEISWKAEIDLSKNSKSHLLLFDLEELKKELFALLFRNISVTTLPSITAVEFDVNQQMEETFIDEMFHRALSAALNVARPESEMHLEIFEGAWVDGDSRKRRVLRFRKTFLPLKSCSVPQTIKNRSKDETLDVSKTLESILVEACFGKGLRTDWDSKTKKLEVILTVPCNLIDQMTESIILKALAKVSENKAEVFGKISCTSVFYLFSEPGKENEPIRNAQKANRNIVVKAGRKRVGYDELIAAEAVKTMVRKAHICKEEVLALRLYTGPMYLLYNARLRGFPSNLVKMMSGNRYETTIFVMISAISNLAKATDIPESRTLYRGLGGKLLSQDFWQKSEGCQFQIQIFRTTSKATSSSEGSVDLAAAEETGRAVAQNDEFLRSLAEVLCADLALPDSPEVLQQQLRVSVKLEHRAVSVLVGVRGFAKFRLLEASDGKLPTLAATNKLVRERLFGAAAQGVEARVGRISNRPKDFQGGIELGMLSTTTDKAVAIRYSGAREKRAIVLEIEAGRIDLGASLGFLSQYPQEEEFLMPPLTCLEVDLSNLCFDPRVSICLLSGTSVRNEICFSLDWSSSGR